MKRIILFGYIISACICSNIALFASEQQTISNNHKEHEIKSGKPLPIHFTTTQTSITIYFEALIGEINLTITDINNKIIYTKLLYITTPISFVVELDMSKEFLIYINDYKPFKTTCL